MNVVFTDEAENDLDAIGLHIVRRNPSRALSYIGELQNCCQDLGRMPYAYPRLARRPASEIRRRVWGNYLIFYRVTPATVEILHILHGARDHDRILFPDDQS